jgi:predicted DNA-binding transcriptional regulator AlpA
MIPVMARSRLLSVRDLEVRWGVSRQRVHELIGVTDGPHRFPRGEQVGDSELRRRMVYRESEIEAYEARTGRTRIDITGADQSAPDRSQPPAAGTIGSDPDTPGHP